ncbi:MAG TPA: hypothetical protein VK660_03610 [Xanthomonadaceae bacterium]|jgi:hypothetical protein|nr:hypothetical protein [Xanthomonadaceae bacterium]
MLFVLFAAFFIPIHGALYLDLSAFDFMMGALSGGNWSVSRCILLVVFCAILLAIAWCIARLAALRRC